MAFYGQFETDRHIAKYFPSNYIGICVDVGMSDPVGGSNTYHFEQKGWQCLCIEPNPYYCQAAQGIRKNVEPLACGNTNTDNLEFEIFTLFGNNQSAISSLKADTRLVQSHQHLISSVNKIQVNVRTLDHILSNHPEIIKIDFVSIDTENTELDVLKGFDINRWKPKLLVIENNYDEPFIADYLMKFNYIRVERIEVNDFFVLCNITLPVSIGEALDKYSILSIKKEKIKEPSRLKDVDNEMSLIYHNIAPIISKYNYHYTCLLNINKDIWDLSDQVRDPLITIDYKNTLFLETFYKNDARFRIKSKLNKLASSNLHEQKSYPGSNITLNPVSDFKIYELKNDYIRYLSLCYDHVILQCLPDIKSKVSVLFVDDPHIIITEYTGNNENNKDLSIEIEPIVNLLGKYDLCHETHISYICGGRLGDFIHALYVVMCKYELTGKRGNVYITDNTSFGGDGFCLDIQVTYRDLYDIVMMQPYVAKFSIYNNQPYDVNLNKFRNYHNLYGESWLEIMSNTFQFPLIQKPWITINKRDDKYKNIILIHRSQHRHLQHFMTLLCHITTKNKCLFITCDIAEYNAFPLKETVELDLKSSLLEMYIAINSCRFFIGNQSSPLAMAYAMFKPSLGEITEGGFYIHKKHYSEFNWLSHTNTSVATLGPYIENREEQNRSILECMNEHDAVSALDAVNVSDTNADDNHPTINYVCGGRLGDFIHALYAVMCKYELTGHKGNVYITDNTSLGGDVFTFDLKRTYDELYPIVSKQVYIASFSIYSDQKYDINLNDFRNYGGLYKESWLQIMANTYQFPLIEKPWITLNTYDDKYKDVVLIHRSTYSHRQIKNFFNILGPIAQKNKCMFITCNVKEYELFPLKYLVPMELKSNLLEMYTAINSCKFFIGNQSSPLVIAYSLFKPALGELTEGRFYDNTNHYESFNWVGFQGNYTKTLNKYTDITIKKDYKHIVIINHTITNCGVYQYGKRLAGILMKSGNIRFSYHEILNAEQYRVVCENNNMDAIIYNYYPTTLPWLTEEVIQHEVPNIGVFHEAHFNVKFDHVLNIDATKEINSIPRPLLDYTCTERINTGIPVIGSFGFGFNSKGFHTLIEYVNDQFDEAIIRLNITSAHFGDGKDNTEALCNDVKRKDTIKVIITHDFMDDKTLLDWLSGNDINIFMYDVNGDRGCSSVIDYALSVNRPIGISNSVMFRHIYMSSIDLGICPIKDIISNGLDHLEKYKCAWKHDKLIEKVEFWLNKIIFSAIKMKNNTVLDDSYRIMLQPAIDEMTNLVPGMMSRKIARANVQQAFAYKYIKDNFAKESTKLVCCGSFEDTCCSALKESGYDIVEIDPVYNYDLHTYCEKYNWPQFDVVFSVSVIEHVKDDDQFVDDMCRLMKRDGTCVVTCDFNNNYRPGDSIPGCDFRFYTENDILVRFKQILDKHDCYIFGEVDYSAPNDFVYDGILYCFGTMIFKKRI